jgi:hypothetical protein
VLLGLTVGSGGITESLVKHAVSCLTTYLHSLDTSTDRGLALVKQFNTALLQVFTDHQRVDRVTLPMLRMLDRLLTSGGLLYLVKSEGTQDGDTSDSSPHRFAMALCQLCKTEVIKCGDIQKLLASIDVFCGLVQFDGEVRKRALSQLMIFLCHAYPVVRKASANKLYESVVMYDGVVDDKALDQLTVLLTETLWDQPLAVVRPIRNELCDLLKVPQPVIVVKST